MRRRRFAGAVGVACLMGLSSALLAACPSVAIAKGGHSVIPANRSEEFRLRGSGGFSISVVASGGAVSLTARKGDLSASYSVRGVASSKRIKARFPGLGLVSVQFHPFGPAHRKAVPPGCKGKDGTVQRGRFVGTVEFEGEQGYTTVHAAQAKGKVTVSRKQVCQNTGGEGGSSFRLTALIATARSEGISVVALRLTRKSRSTVGFAGFGATLFESLGRLSIVRSIEASGGINTFTTSETGREITSATITPPSPFTGSATYEKQKGSPATWTGTLAGTFLGHGEVSLVGPQFTAEISP
jgi:hypothetical protein